MKIKHVLTALTLSVVMLSCSSDKLVVSGVGYQSIRTTYAQPKKIPADAKIAVEYFIASSGEIMGIVYNLTSDILVLDQTKSFLINSTGESVSYYDPTVVTNTVGSFSSETASTTVNLGAIANAFGVSGRIGTLLGGVNVGSAATVGSMSSTSVAVYDQPKVRIGPKGKISLSKRFKVKGVGQYTRGNNYVDVSASNAPIRFSVCLTYSLDDEATYDKLVTEFYVNSNILEPVSNGRVSDAFRKIYGQKSDALVENAFMFSVNNNLPTKFTNDAIWGDRETKVYDKYVRGSLIDYK